MATLDQVRAQIAFKNILSVKDWEKADRDKYGSIVHAMPALVRSAGLSQALHFVRSRKSAEKPYLHLLKHLATQLRRIDDGITDEDKLLTTVREAALPKYLRLTNEALACITWYRRFVQGELGIEAGESDADAEP
jgi:CRISPR-associated protein Cmr5